MSLDSKILEQTSKQLTRAQAIVMKTDVSIIDQPASVILFQYYLGYTGSYDPFYVGKGYTISVIIHKLPENALNGKCLKTPLLCWDYEYEQFSRT